MCLATMTCSELHHYGFKSLMGFVSIKVQKLGCSLGHFHALHKVQEWNLIPFYVFVEIWAP